MPSDIAESDVLDTNKTSSSRANRKRGASDLADVIRELGNSQMRSELASKKLSYMEKEDGRREKEMNIQEKEIIMREAEHSMRQAEHQQQMHTNSFDEREKIRANIRAIREDLRNPSLDQESKSDLLEDMAGLKKRKNFLATFLGFDTTS